MPPRRKRKEDQEPSAPFWMATFSDLATLLLAFFVLLYSFSIIDIQKFETFIASFRGTGLLDNGRNPIDKIDSDDQTDDSLDRLKEKGDDFENDLESQLGEEFDLEDLDDNLLEVYYQVKAYLDENNLGGQISVNYETRGIVLEIKDTVLFDSGETDIKPAASPFLDKLAGFFKEVDNEVSIEGHTDNVPTRPINHATNWELSNDRAAKVVRYFTEEKGLSARKFSAVGYGEWRPIASNKTVEGKALNRRVVIVVLAEDQYESRVILDGTK